MKALGKILGLFFLGLLLIIVALGFALTHLFDPNDYKDEIRQLARDKANLELTLNGDIGWSLFPWLGLELTDATLASASTPDKPFANLRLLGLSVRVLPLLRKEVQMSDIRVDGLNLDLQRDENGHGNWEDVGRPAAKPGATPAEQTAAGEPQQPQSEPAQDSGAPIKLDIDSLIVNGARVDYRDAQKGQQFSAESIQLTTGAIREGAGVPIKLSAFFGSNQPVMRARTELQGELRFDRVLKRYQLEDARLSGEASGEPFNGQTLTYAAQGQLLVDLAAQVAEWNGLKLSANQLRALGELKIRDLQSEPKLSGGLSVAPVNLREFLASLGQKLPPMSDEKTLSQFELVTKLGGTPSSLALDELTLKLDESTFTGKIAVADFAKQALRVQLKGDKLNLDRYLPPASKDKKDSDTARKAEVRETVANAGQAGSTPVPNAPTQQAWSSSEVLPIPTLRKLDLQATLNLEQLTVHKQAIDKFSVKARSQGGTLNLEELRGNLGGGNFTIKADADVRPAVPVLSLHTQLNGIPVEPFLKDEQRPSPLKGLLDLKSDLTTSGNSQKAWIDALNGTASFLLNNGVLVDANLEQQLCRGIATLNRKSLSSDPRSKDTPFERLQGSLNIRNGVASNPDLQARIPGLAVTGDGDLDLRVLGLDYRVGITIEGDQREMPDPACEVNRRYAGVAWPLHCRGPLELGAKACRLDQEGMGKVAAKLAGDRINEKLEEKLGDKVSPELKDALKGLFNR
ncbi:MULTISPECIES: AsmA family protein [Pseudomonas]|uniref:Cell envelope biogenesis protein AsmA n=2 Tax=Pseudomonadaceae TaxID=135621 RepID=A0A0D0IV09_9PSED|nr:MULTISPECIES: AsmA family protein [Pseudomonas]KIP96997.1 cell envelope biogenesis protein AsmA [Pseudomonas fulva]MCW2290467.1 AsmA protein [Pseudomonas sp. BIGb0408]NYH74960.1 AsmA protein [Pseudomonas flavescens]